MSSLLFSYAEIGGLPGTPQLGWSAYFFPLHLSFPCFLQIGLFFSPGNTGSILAQLSLIPPSSLFLRTIEMLMFPVFGMFCEGLTFSSCLGLCDFFSTFWTVSVCSFLPLPPLMGLAGHPLAFLFPPSPSPT